MCGGELGWKRIDHRERLSCPACGFIYYQNPAPAAGIILLDAGRVLLVKRKFEPRKGAWSLPAGFIEADEDVRACAIREMKEETHLDVKIVRLFNVYSAFDDPRTSAVLIVYLAEKVGGELHCGDDASDARYFALNKLPEDIAFEAHRRALTDVSAYLSGGACA